MSKRRIERTSCIRITIGILAAQFQLLRALGVSLAWDPSPDTNVVGYAIYYGTNSGNYRTRVEVGNQTNTVVHVVTNGTTYYFVATASTAAGLESLPSNEVTFTPSSGTAPITPVVSITSPTTSPVFSTTNSSLNLSGVASDDRGVTQVRWSNACSQVTGVASGTTSWSANNLPLCVGTNRFTITALDADGNFDSATLVVVRSAPTCNASLGLVSWPAASTGGSTNVQLTISGGCAWTASSPCGWLTVSPSSGSGSVVVTLVATSNSGTNSRSCQLSIANQTLNVTQSPPATAIVVSPTDLSLTSGATNFCLNVTAGSGQLWIASSGSDWLRLTSSGVQTGSGTVCFAADASTNCVSRIGTLTVGGRAVQVHQPGKSQSVLVARTFNGLFTNGTSQLNSGFLTLKSSASGTFSGKLSAAGGKWSFKGQFDSARHATVNVLRTDRSPLNLQLQLDACDAESLSGFVSDGSSTAQLQAFRNIFNAAVNPCPYAGKYTFVVPGATNSLSPPGHGFGSASVLSNGTARIVGVLGDGTKFKMSGWMAPTGTFPLHAPLYRRLGSVYGWLAAQDDPTNGNPHGRLAWTKPANVTDRYYPGGFTNTVAIFGSRYRSPELPSDYVVGFTNGLVRFVGANLPEVLDREVALLPGNVVAVTPAPTNTVSGRMSMKIKTNQGLFSGSVSLPLLGRSLKYQGAILQDFNAGYGFCRGTNQTGEVIFAAPAN